MRFLIISLIILSAGLSLQIYAKINLQVSYKYEVDLMETNINTNKEISEETRKKWLSEMEIRKAEIITQQKETKVLFWIFLTGSLIVLGIIIFKLLNRPITA